MLMSKSVDTIVTALLEWSEKVLNSSIICLTELDSYVET